MRFIFALALFFPSLSLCCTKDDMVKVASELIAAVKKSQSISEAFMTEPHLRGEGKDQIYESILYYKSKDKSGKVKNTASLIQAKMEAKSCLSLKPFFATDMTPFPGFE